MDSRHRFIPIILFFFAFGVSQLLYSQQNKIDSIYKLPLVKTDTAIVLRWLTLSELHFMVDQDSTIFFANKAIDKSRTIFYKKGEAIGLINLAMALSDRGSYDSAQLCLDNAIKILPKSENKYIGNAHNEKGMIHFRKGNLKDAKLSFEKSMSYKVLSKDSAALASGYNNLGVVCRNMSDYNCALDYYFKALRIRERTNNQKGISQSYTNIAIVYGNLYQHQKSLEYDLKALKIKLQLDDKFGIAKSYNNIASTYSTLQVYDSAIFYNEKAIEIRKVINDRTGLASSYYNLGGIFINLGKYDKANNYLLHSLEIYNQLEDRLGQSLCYMALGSCQRYLKNYSQAEKHFATALEIVKETGATDQLKDIYSELSLSGAESGNYKNAYSWLKLLMNYKDSVLNQTNNEKLAELEKIYQTEKKELQIQNLKQENKIKESEISHNKLKTTYLSVVLLLVAGFGIVTFRSLRNKQKANKIIVLQKQEVEKKNIIIEEKNKDITDSINYAKRLQQAILPPQRSVAENFNDSFILYKPKDIVAGDFYWMELISPRKEKEEKIILLAVADCTGHGVPGAMVSVVCSNALNRAIKEFGITDPGKILDKVTDLVIETFEKSESEVMDGMDISLCAFNMSSKTIQWAGANNPLWIVRKSSTDLLEIKPNKQPIGKFTGRQPFSTHTLNLVDDDTLYFFTDGYADQFGGKKGKKFKYNQLKELLSNIRHKPLIEQKEILDQTFETWKNDLEQVDDVCIIGIKI